MWLSQGNINLNHHKFHDVVWDLSKIKLESGYVSYYVFHKLLYENINHALSVVSVGKHFEINPGKNRFLAAYFKQQSTIPAIVYHTPKELDWLDNQDYIPQNIEDYNIAINSFDHEEKIMFVRKDWFNTDKDFKLQCKIFWQEKMNKWGTIQWYQHGKLVFEFKSKNEKITKIELKHPMGIWESICYLTGLENYRKLNYFTKIS